MKVFYIMITVILLIGIYIYIGNNFISISNYTINKSRNESNIRIVHISDLHSKVFGKNNEKLIKKIKNQNPDIIVFTGDLIDNEYPEFEESVKMLNKLHDLFPVFFVFGNHDVGKFEIKKVLKKHLLNNGIRVLDNEVDEFVIKGTKLSILGVCEYNSSEDKGRDGFKMSHEFCRNLLKEFEKKSTYKILLSHFAENFDFYDSYKYCKFKVDLVLTGHTHGGLINIPFYGGLIAPEQGRFPKYYGGLYEKNGVKMIVNRGLGNSGMSFRINNQPEIGVIDIIK